jgi:hypothetical protein
MERASNIVSRINTRQKLTLIKPLDKHYDDIPQPAQKNCARCHNAGWTRQPDFDPLVSNKVTTVPCPACMGGRRAKQSEVRQAQLVEQLFGGSDIPELSR